MIYISIGTILAVGIGGFIGSISRLYFNAIINNNLYLLSIPLGTLFVNLLGSFLIGVLFSFFHTIQIDPTIKSFLTTGLLGGLTTFSTFSYETFLFIQAGNIKLALINIILNVFGTILMVWIGSKI